MAFNRYMTLLVTLVFCLIFIGHSNAETVFGRVVGITDGDTFTLLTIDYKQLKIRLAEIDAPERGQPYGTRSRQALADLIFQKDVRVEVQVVDQYGRLVGRPYVGRKDICTEMIEIGAAWVYRTYSEDVALYDLERQAKANSMGLWGLPEYDRVPPWEWRHGAQSRSANTSDLEPFRCGAKNYCREMVSCDEAKFHLHSCRLMRLDGDGDGVPCEAICQ